MRDRISSWFRRPTPAFLVALLFDGSPAPLTKNDPSAGDIESLSQDEWELVVEEGRRQLDAQADRLQHVQGRAQALLTVCLALLAVVVGGYGRIRDESGEFDCWPRVVLWIVGAGLVVVGLALSAAVIAVRADFDQIDTTTLTQKPRPLWRETAKEYANAVKRGEVTVADRVTVYRLATRYTVWGALVTFVVYLVTA